MKDKDLNDIFVKNLIEETIIDILDKHQVFYIKDGGLHDFVSMINTGNLFFEIYEHDRYTYITTKYHHIGHFKFSNDSPEEIYDAAEMIGFLLGRKYANPYYAV